MQFKVFQMLKVLKMLLLVVLHKLMRPGPLLTAVFGLRVYDGVATVGLMCSEYKHLPLGRMRRATWRIVTLSTQVHPFFVRPAEPNIQDFAVQLSRWHRLHCGHLFLLTWSVREINGEYQCISVCPYAIDTFNGPMHRRLDLGRALCNELSRYENSSPHLTGKKSDIQR